MPPSNKTETDSLAVAVVLLELAKIASVLVRSLRTRIVPNHSAFRGGIQRAGSSAVQQSTILAGILTALNLFTSFIVSV
jgi:hypothetical protein